VPSRLVSSRLWPMGLCRATSYASELVCINAGLGISSMPWLHSACLTAETDLYLDRSYGVVEH
jgi:hypothetical protein